MRYENLSIGVGVPLGRGLASARYRYLDASYVALLRVGEIHILLQNVGGCSTKHSELHRKVTLAD